jgi:hypothetical protein
VANGLKSESSVRLPSSEFDRGYASTFACSEPQRGKWRVDPKTGELIEYGAPPPAEAKLQINTDTHYADLRATDGTPIDSRRKHQEYMHANGLCLADDFKESMPKLKAEREQRLEGSHPEQVKDRVRDVVETMKKLAANPRLAVRRREGVDPDE